MKTRIIIIAAILLLKPLVSIAIFFAPMPIPIDRFVKNRKAYLEKNPNDHASYYTLGRIYYLGFFNRSSYAPAVRVFEGEKDADLLEVAPDWLIGEEHLMILRFYEAERRAFADLGFKPHDKLPLDTEEEVLERCDKHYEELKNIGWVPGKVSIEDALSYAIKSQKNFKIAIGMAPKEAIYHLGLASLYEQVLSFLKSQELKSKEFTHINNELILDTYWKTFKLSVEEDSKLDYIPLTGLRSVVSYEAGNAWLRLGGIDAKRKQIIQLHLAKIGDLKKGPITPLVVTKDNIETPGEFVLNDYFVKFDLDGEGHQEMWEWVTPTTGFLVWDPNDNRTINSGARLFGNYAFQIFWSDGFRALSLLDDNGDGSITGAELSGLSVWYDSNSNGLSEPSEVKPIRDHGIEALNFGDLTTVRGTCVSRKGVIYSNSLSGHLWDWISECEDPKPQQSGGAKSLKPASVKESSDTAYRLR